MLTEAMSDDKLLGCIRELGLRQPRQKRLKR